MKNKPSLQDIESFNIKVKQELEQEPAILEESTTTLGNGESKRSESEIINIIRVQRNEIEKLNRELAGVVDQLKAQQKRLDQQEVEISELRAELVNKSSRNEAEDKPRKADLSYNKQLILQNIITLIEEKGFSFNDVARLFKLEGFRPPSPYVNWSDRVVEELYATTG